MEGRVGSEAHNKQSTCYVLGTGSSLECREQDRVPALGELMFCLVSSCTCRTVMFQVVTELRRKIK